MDSLISRITMRCSILWRFRSCPSCYISLVYLVISLIPLVISLFNLILPIIYAPLSVIKLQLQVTILTPGISVSGVMESMGKTLPLPSSPLPLLFPLRSFPSSSLLFSSLYLSCYRNTSSHSIEISPEPEDRCGEDWFLFFPNHLLHCSDEGKVEYSCISFHENQEKVEEGERERERERGEE